MLRTTKRKPGVRYHYGSSFRVKPNAKPAKRSALKKSRKPMKKIGRRTKDWRSVWRWLKPRLEAAGRKYCEFDFIIHTCEGFLTPAHSKKRRLMRGDDIYMVALACVRVHRVLDEEMSHEQMEAAVLKAIERAGGPILPERDAL